MAWPKGKPRDAATCAKISAARKGKPVSPEAKERIAAANRKRVEDAKQAEVAS